MTGTDVGALFDAGAREFDAWSDRLWDRMGALTVEAADPRPGERVLDACCGAGASALPAARAVAPAGAVDAVDLSQALLDQGRRRAAAHGVDNLTFTAADVCAWPRPATYDLVQVVHGVAFFPDMDAGTSHLVRALRPGGRMVVTVWAEGALASLMTLLRQAVSDVTGRTVAPPGFQQARERIADADRTAAWLHRLGLRGVRTRRHDRHLPLDPATAWEFVLGNAARSMLDGLPGPARDRVRARLADLMERDALTRLDVSILIAVGHRPASGH
ncbi:ubiquinone/menaquinone biosynthesis C-methylase UbiE [Nocardiopsis mwathae]|uniref:Ubiquinone/menaquinone biosynthesis C-methylase UbiE n=1 Tax=Nocardiopsis mwathae TaxID=1472723 RepID=A0A7W9YGQ6_9ACTN|nr:methyltransferase domain-containing protein [Nocardiopsis mwathae]MBB6171834.1 ubiquinone/menaquinone biosynthesis C-methylase UbiE [Nocardiopsis mwathae]